MSTRHPQAIAVVRAARGSEADAAWGSAAVMRLVTHEVRREWADRALREAAQTLASSSESAEELFGPAEQWAAEQVRTWVETDAPAFLPPDQDVRELTPRFLVIAALFYAGWVSLLFGVICLLRWEWNITLTPVWAAAPLLLSAMIMLVGWLYQRLSIRRGLITAVPVTLVLIIVFSLGAAGLFQLSRGMGEWSTHLTIWLALSAGYGMLAAITAKLWPQRPLPHPASGRSADSTASTDLESLWQQKAREALRARGGLTEHQIQEALTEAREHARDSETSLWDEFGDPWAYARKLPRDPVVSARRRVWYHAALLAFLVLLVTPDLTDGTPNPWFIGGGALLLLLEGREVTRQVRRFRAVRRERG